MSSEFYIKYQNNSPVPIDTSFGRGPQQSLPLLTVAHLIQGTFTLVIQLFNNLLLAATEDSTRRLLGLPVEYGPLSIKLLDGTPLNRGTHRFRRKLPSDYRFSNEWDYSGRVSSNYTKVSSRNSRRRYVFYKSYLFYITIF